MVVLGEYTGTRGGGKSHAHRRPGPAPRPSNPLRAARNRVRESPAALSTPVSLRPRGCRAERQPLRSLGGSAE